ncbi:MAG: sugar phosphate isomerase/epimerase [Chloroflexi bacterium]|nr:sugar phosphate isomerase/epimerase [Chloroflexota bacterium]
MPGTLTAIAEMGYAGVELFAANYAEPAARWRGWLAERGLRVCGAHTRLEMLLGDEFERTVAFNLELGNPFVVVPMLPEARRRTRADWAASGSLLNDLAARLSERGLRLGYHNHTWEFVPVDGAVPWDILFGNAAPGLSMQLDVGHALEAGADPAAVLRRYPGRATTVHLVEYSRANPLALLGEGDVPWSNVLSTCREAGGTEWFIIEQEQYPYSQLECARRCLAGLRRLLD